MYLDTVFKCDACNLKLNLCLSAGFSTTQNSFFSSTYVCLLILSYMLGMIMFKHITYKKLGRRTSMKLCTVNQSLHFLVVCTHSANNMLPRKHITDHTYHHPTYTPLKHLHAHMSAIKCFQRIVYLTRMLRIRIRY